VSKGGREGAKEGERVQRRERGSKGGREGAKEVEDYCPTLFWGLDAP